MEPRIAALPKAVREALDCLTPADVASEPEVATASAKVASIKRRFDEDSSRLAARRDALAACETRLVAIDAEIRAFDANHDVLATMRRGQCCR
ncbi:MAG: hypothetical protein IT516_17260 [Burkholderiales bacterium]|nr:hypothetical protein [Burkholderiales bacterium]